MAASGQQVEINTTGQSLGRPFMDWLMSPSSSHHITLKTAKLGNLTSTNPKDLNSHCVHKKKQQQHFLCLKGSWLQYKFTDE